MLTEDKHVWFYNCMNNNAIVVWATTHVRLENENYCQCSAGEMGHYTVHIIIITLLVNHDYYDLCKLVTIFFPSKKTISLQHYKSLIMMHKIIMFDTLCLVTAWYPN